MSNLQSVVFAVGYKKYDLKTTEVVASGTKQKTEGFEVRKNWVLFCGDFNLFYNLFSFCFSVLILAFLFLQIV